MRAAQRPYPRGQVVSDRSESGRAPRTWPVLALIALAAVVAYAPSFMAPFQFDDEARLLHNMSMQKGSMLDALRWLGNSRVVPSLTFLLNYRVDGLDPFGYHVINFAVHLLAALGVFSLALALCATPRLRAAWPRRRALLVAGVAAFLFACHPLQTQAVTYIIQRYASMAALFYVWAVVCYLRARLAQERGDASPGPYIAGSLLLAVCAVLSKEHAVTLPAALVLAEWVGFGRPRLPVLLACGAAALTILAIPITWKIVTWEPSIKTVSAKDVPLLTRLEEAILKPRHSVLRDARPAPLAYLMTQTTVLPRYLGLVAVPRGLNVDHDVPFAQGLSGSVVAGAVLLFAVAAVGVWQLARRPLLAFGILWFFVTLSVESSVLPIDDPMVEHRMYLAMAGLVISIAYLAALAAARAPRSALAAGALAALVLVSLTFARNVIWMSPLTLWLDTVEKSPNKARPHTNLGAAYYKSDHLDDAVEQSCQALKLAPEDPIASDNLDLALTLLGVYDDVVPEIVERRPDGSVLMALPAPVTFCPKD